MQRFKIVSPFVLAALAAASLSASAQAEDCYADWGTAGAVVRKEKLVTVQQLSQPGAAGVQGEIVKTTLCKDGDDFIYKLVVRDAKGQLRTVVIDARGPNGAATVPAAGVQSLQSK